MEKLKKGDYVRITTDDGCDINNRSCWHNGEIALIIKDETYAYRAKLLYTLVKASKPDVGRDSILVKSVKVEKLSESEARLYAL